MKRFVILIGICAVLAFCSVSVGAVDGDINRDGVVNFADFLILANNYGIKGSPQYQANEIEGIYEFVPNGPEEEWISGHLSISRGAVIISMLAGASGGITTVGTYVLKADIFRVHPVVGDDLVFVIEQTEPELHLRFYQSLSDKTLFRWRRIVPSTQKRE